MTHELNESPKLLDEPATRSQKPPHVGKAEKRLGWIRSRFLWLGSMLLLSGLAVGLMNLSGHNPQDTRKVSSILPVETMRARPVGSYPVLRTYTGEITARRSSELGFERSGELVLISADEGNRVKAGTSLATLDTRNLEAQRRELLAQRVQAVALLKELQAGPRSQTVAAARASVRDLREQLELARTKRTRRDALYAEGVIAREQLDETAFEAGALEGRLGVAQSNLDELLAGTRSERIEGQTALVEQLDASLANLEVNVAKSTIKAPFTGRISARRVDEGTVVSAGQSVLRLVEDEVPEVRIGIPVQTAAKLQPGSRQSVRVGKKTYTAFVSSLLPELNEATRTVTVVLLLDASAVAEVTPGQTARLELSETIATSGYQLPTTALVPGVRGLWSTYVLAENGESGSADETKSFRVERRDVEILHTQSDQVLVRGTLQPDDRVIVNGTHRIVPGQLVRPDEL